MAGEKPKPTFNFKSARTPGKFIFQAKDLIIGYDSPLSAPLSLQMERGQKIALTGANGIGKSTLLKSILGLIKPISGYVELGENVNIGYFEQEMSPDIQTTCMEEIWQEFPAQNIQFPDNLRGSLFPLMQGLNQEYSLIMLFYQFR